MDWSLSAVHFLMVVGCGVLDIGSFMPVALSRPLCGTVAVVGYMWVGRCGSVALDRLGCCGFVVVDHFESIALYWLLCGVCFV